MNSPIWGPGGDSAKGEIGGNSHPPQIGGKRNRVAESKTQKIKKNHNQTMYLYFPTANCVLTCDAYPRAIPIDEMKAKNLQHLCNKWEKRTEGKDNETFTLSFTYQKDLCTCEGELNRSFFYIHCPTCGKYLDPLFEEGAQVYLQNSGYQDHICVRKNQSTNCLLRQVPGYPNIYSWANVDEFLFALHLTKNQLLSDDNVDTGKGTDLASCYLLFVEEV